MSDKTESNKDIEIIKLKEKIKSLEEDIEDLEDDLDDTKKRLKTSQTDYQKLDDEHNNVQKILNDTLRNLSNSEIEKSKLQQKLQAITDSNEFVKEILLAPEVSSIDTQRLYEDLAKVRFLILGRLLDCYVKLNGKYIVFGSDSFEKFKKDWIATYNEWEAVKRKRWLWDKTTIAFIGEFSAGKTSIVNRILSQDDPNAPKLPVDTKATTAIATYITNGKVTSFQFVTPNNKIKDISKKTFLNKVTKEVLDQTKGLSSLIKYFVMTTKNPNLSRLSILDTPGFSSNSEEDSKRTLEVVNECDALYWVFDVNCGEINANSIKIIKEHLRKPLYIIINKTDLVSPSQTNETRKKIEKTLAKEGIKIEEVFYFSSNAPVENIMKTIRSVKKETDKKNYLKNVIEQIEGIHEMLSKSMVKHNKSIADAKGTCEECDEAFRRHMSYLVSDCNSILQIPEEEVNLFSANCYKMSVSDYNKMKDLLSTSEQRIRNIGQVYSNRINASIDWVYSEPISLELKEAMKDLEEIRNLSKKLFKRVQYEYI